MYCASLIYYARRPTVYLLMFPPLCWNAMPLTPELKKIIALDIPFLSTALLHHHIVACFEYFSAKSHFKYRRDYYFDRLKGRWYVTWTKIRPQKSHQRSRSHHCFAKVKIKRVSNRSKSKKSFTVHCPVSMTVGRFVWNYTPGSEKKCNKITLTALR